MVLSEEAEANKQQPIRFSGKESKLLRRDDETQNREAKPAVTILSLHNIKQPVHALCNDFVRVLLAQLLEGFGDVHAGGRDRGRY